MELRARVNMGLVTEQTMRIARLLNGDSGAMAPVLDAVGQMVAGWHVRNMMESGRRFGGWPRIHPVWALLRRRGSGSKVRDWKGAVRLAYTAKPLQDTGYLRTSLQARGANSVYKIGRLEVTVGTRVKYAMQHQLGGTDIFIFGAKQRRTFDKNVAKVLPGRKPPGSRAQRNWNPFYFQMLAYFKKKSGKPVKVKKREIIIQRLDAREQRLIQAEVTRQLDILTSRGGGRP